MTKNTLFISWSGMLSQNIAEELKSFFEETLQSLNPFFSPDITKGTGWLEKINEAIDNSTSGIICLTKENIHKPWILWEAGALSRVGLVCPIAFDFKKDDIKSPLNAFQSSEFNKKEFKKLFTDLCENSNSGIKSATIERYFETGSTFDRLEKRITDILNNYEYNSNPNEDEFLFLLHSIDSKLNKALGTDSSDNDLTLQYIEAQLNGLLNIIDSLKKTEIKLEQEPIKDILRSADYFLSNVSNSFNREKVVKKLEKLNEKIATL